MERDDKTISEDARRQGCTRCARALRIASAACDLVAHRACSLILPTDGSRATIARQASQRQHTWFKVMAKKIRSEFVSKPTGKVVEPESTC